MDALILTCGTGGGHNAAAKAIAEELNRRGDRSVILNPYTLCGTRIERVIDRAYISLVQRFPRAFGLVYLLGELYRHLPFRSPVYFFNKKAAEYMEEYLSREHFDIVIVTHLFPGEIMTWLKNHDVSVPPVIYVATDYTCIPFTEDTDCDAYVVPAKELIQDFAKRGIPENRIYPLGIPVQASFRKQMTCAEAKEMLGLESDIDYLLLSGGSMGAGRLSFIVRKLRRLCDSNMRLIVICGSNERLFKKLERKYGGEIILLKSTELMAAYVRASKIYFTKPGGLSSTEAADMSAMLVHLPPIPGCETKNAHFFTENGMSCYFKASKKGITRLLSLAEDGQVRNEMAQSQQDIINVNAHEGICDLAQNMVQGEVSAEASSAFYLSAFL